MPAFDMLIHGSEGWDPVDDNVDVEIRLDDGRRFVATFFTLENLRTLLARYRDTGECDYGRYFWAADMIVVKELTTETIVKTIEDLLRSGELVSAFSEIGQDACESVQR